MALFSRIDTNHHATLLEGDFPMLRDELINTLEKSFSTTAEGNPDFQIRSYETLGIDEARELKAQAGFRPTGNGVKIFIISFNSIGAEAQNALLKLFEEPAEKTFFFLVGKAGSRILPTLRSRLNVIFTTHGSSGVTEAKKFLAQTSALRIEYVQDIIEERDRARAELLLSGIEEELHDSKKISAHATALREVVRARGYLNDRSSSVKLLMEHLALILPQQ